MSDEQKPTGDRVTTPKKVPKRSPMIKDCKICQSPQDIQAEVKKMLVGTPASPLSNPPVKARWVFPSKVAEWLGKLPTPIFVTTESVRWHQHQHLRIRRDKIVAATKPFVNVAPPPSPNPAPSSDLTASGAKKRHRRGGYTNEPPQVALPVERHREPIGISQRSGISQRIFSGNAPALEETQLLDPQPTEDASAQGNAAAPTMNPSVVEVVDGTERMEDQLDQLALAPPPQANTDLAYFELAFRENAKTQAHFARQLRKRPDGSLTQAEAYLLVNGSKSLSDALVNYRQAMALVKGGRSGALAVVDQKRGLKGLLHSDRVVIPGDIPPKDAEPVGVPMPLEEQLTPTNQTLPVGDEGIPDKLPLPTSTLSDLSAPIAPASSTRPVMDGVGGGGSGGSTGEPMQKAVGDGVGEGRVGATVTPIKPLKPKSWDSVT